MSNVHEYIIHAPMPSQFSGTKEQNDDLLHRLSFGFIFVNVFPIHTYFNQWLTTVWFIIVACINWQERA